MDEQSELARLRAEYGELVGRLAEQAPSNYNHKLDNSPAGREILALTPGQQRGVALLLLDWLAEHKSSEAHSSNWHMMQSLYELVKRKPPLQEQDVVQLVEHVAAGSITYSGGVPPLIGALERYLARGELTPRLREAMDRLIGRIEAGSGDSEAWRWRQRLHELAGRADTTLPLAEGDAWADAAIAEIGALDADEQARWRALLNLCLDASGGKPGASWLKRAEPALEALGFERFRGRLQGWLSLLDRPRTGPVYEWQGGEYYMLDANITLLQGMLWLCAGRADRELARAVAAVVPAAYRKLPGHGPRAARLGNAALWVLGTLSSSAGAEQLAILKAKMKGTAVQKAIQGALDSAAQRLGLPEEAIEELSVPDYGLQQVGAGSYPIGDHSLELSITGASGVEQHWLAPDGQRLSSPPRALKQQHAERLKELSAMVAELGKMLPAQRERIESLYLERKSWPLVEWRERYLDHPLVGALARRLIWSFSRGERSQPAIWQEGQLVGCYGEPLGWLDDATQVALWHPIESPMEEVLAWRRWLYEQELQQPFKQAHREIYLLTDAERASGIYSNRFAAHVLRQHQFNALCAARRWKNQLRLMVDGVDAPASRVLAAWGLRAEFWIEGAGDTYGVDTNSTGTYLYLTTDQVRFNLLDPAQSQPAPAGSPREPWRGGRAGEPVPIEQIPPLVFSEIMRDVDLFVGVASVGNDPSWSDGGPQGRHRAYWNSYSFGDLSEIARVRRQVLERLLPRLKVAERCTLSERFLVVRGDLRTYKIHLGSGNILMEPNDQYLCIVPARGSGSEGGQHFLPFEGDQLLAIILSKALLLAGDKHIKDPSILSQIRGS